jgi:hypothetical protein
MFLLIQFTLLIYRTNDMSNGEKEYGWFLLNFVLLFKKFADLQIYLAFLFQKYLLIQNKG